MNEKQRILNLSICAICLLLFNIATAQQKDSYGVKKIIGKGNQSYVEQDYAAAENLYTNAIDENPRSSVARFNLGNSQFKQKKFDEAIKTFGQMPKAADVSYNLGNSYLQKEEYEKAIEAYKESLRKNPSDMEAKANLTYAKAKLYQQNNQNKNQNKDNQDQNKDNQDKQDQNKYQQDKE